MGICRLVMSTRLACRHPRLASRDILATAMRCHLGLILQMIADMAEVPLPLVIEGFQLRCVANRLGLRTTSS